MDAGQLLGAAIVFAGLIGLVKEMLVAPDGDRLHLPRSDSFPVSGLSQRHPASPSLLLA